MTAESPKPPLPDVVGDEEIIVRALKTPAHYDSKKNRLKPAAFRAPPGGTVISVARSLVGIGVCKSNVTRGPDYIGFGAIRAHSIRRYGSTVVDAPEDYYGHAHVEHPSPAPARDEPQESAANLEYVSRLRNLISATRTYIDERRDEEGWGGPDPLEAPAVS